MAPFYPLYVTRSDGVLFTINHHKKEPNEPNAEQLDQTPDAKGVADYYRLLPRDEAKHVDWRRKLGAMLIREIGTKEQISSESGYILYDLPENYRLYEHIKSSTNPGDVKQTKNHSGGGHQRQDAYLYGSPKGKKKRFRSPGDFFPHLLWLATDAEGDPNNCTCKVCAPEDLQPDEPREPKSMPIKQEAFALKAGKDAGKSPEAPYTPDLPAPQTGSGRMPAYPTLTPNSTQTPTSMPQVQQPQPIPRPVDQDQQVDLEYDSFIYRQGELVWFNRGDAWGLGVMVRRFKWFPNPQGPIRAYIVQPLSHPYQNQSQVTISNDNMLRPWLKWSAPGLMTSGLARLRNLTYDTTDWQGVLNGVYGDRANAEVDASILAAKAIDATYTLFKPISVSNPDPNTQERRFAGIFFGGEKMWIGDAVRLHTKSGSYVLVLHGIVERTQMYASQQPAASVILTGDTFRLAQVANPQTDRSPSVGVPVRMLKDVESRNALVQNKVFWKSSGAQAQYGLQSVRGRWYEASVHGPRIEPQEWQRSIASGYISEACDKWNGRGDAQRDEDRKDSITQKQDRVAAFGKAVPQNTILVDGVQAPPPPEIAKIQQEPEPEPEPMPMEDGFLNFEDDIGGFQNSYGAGHGGSGNFNS